MKISDSDLKEVLKNHGIEEVDQASIISQLETREVIEDTKSKREDDQSKENDSKDENSAKLAEELGYKTKKGADGDEK